MLTARYVGDRTVETREAAPVPPGRGEVQIRVAYTGLCGTDLHVFHGDMDARVRTPLVLGHEMSGTVEAVGPDVPALAPGDAVTVMPLEWDGTCPACLAGHQHVCQHLDFIGIDSPGALQELWTVPAAVVIPLPAAMRLDHAALVEPVAVAVHDVRRAALQQGERVVVIGGGPIGLLIATVARRAGTEVVVIEVDAARRAQVEALGFEALDPLAVDQVDFVERWTAGTGADAVFEVSGAASAVLGATSLAKVRGRLVVVAIHPTPREVDLQRLFWRELTIIGARVYERDDFETAVRLIAEDAIPADVLITRIVPITAVQEAFAVLERGEAMKLLVDVRSGAAT